MCAQELFWKEIGKDAREHPKNKNARRHVREMQQIVQRGVTYSVGRLDVSFFYEFNV